MSHHSFTTLTENLNQALTTFRGDQPDAMAAFTALSRAALADGALTMRQKELMALAIGIAGHCDGCIGFHVKTLQRLKVPRDQFMETLAVAVYMGGGPSLMYAAEAIRAYEEFGNKGTP